MCDFVERLPTTDTGKLFSLYDWQRKALMEFYGTMDVPESGTNKDAERLRRYWYLYLEIPKKNGKSELAAALALYHLFADGELNAEVYVCAADKDNASIVFNAAVFMATSAPWTAKMIAQGELRPIESRKRIEYRKRVKTGNGGYKWITVGILQVLSAEAYSKHGYKPSCVIFDELHAQPNRELWDVMTGAAGASRRQPAWIVLTTAGDDPDDLEKLDIWDESLWYLCNPSLGKHLSLRNIRMEAASAKRSEAEERVFRWLRLNQWITTKSVGWISLNLYDKTQWGPSKKREREEWLRQLDGKLCYGGVDLSTSRDLTAFVLLFPPQPGLDAAVLLPYGIWRPEATVDEAEKRDHVPYRDWARAGFLDLCPGEVIDYGAVEERIREARERYDLKMVGFDPYLSRTITQRLAPIVPIIEIPQDLKNMSPAMKETDDMMQRHTLLHVHNTCFRWTFGNVRCHADGNGNIKPLKNKSTGRIDPAVASIIVMAVWMVARNQKPDLAAAVARADFTL